MDNKILKNLKIVGIFTLIVLSMIFLVYADRLVDVQVNLNIREDLYNHYDREAQVSDINTLDYINQKVESYLEEDYHNLLLEQAEDRVAYIDTEEEEIKRLLLRCLRYQYEENQTIEYYRETLTEQIKVLDNNKLKEFIRCR